MSLSDCPITSDSEKGSAKKEPKYEEVGFTLKNGMKISLHRPGLHGESVEGEHIDLVIEHPNGSRAIVVVTCSGRTNGDKYVDFTPYVGQPLKMNGVTYASWGPSFQPFNLDYVGISADNKIDCVVKGVFSNMRLNLVQRDKKYR
ncbi:hypothetical protein K9M47_00115 [Candidatus Gracilibacteria bacterium]|nr:hypothetical protein [Candidatus Gracilibacteria bacterium]MCF7898381.1 hypothetical protein [Candidatus Paceibacterota bacterium]